MNTNIKKGPLNNNSHTLGVARHHPNPHGRRGVLTPLISTLLNNNQFKMIKKGLLRRRGHVPGQNNLVKLRRQLNLLRRHSINFPLLPTLGLNLNLNVNITLINKRRSDHEGHPIGVTKNNTAVDRVWSRLTPTNGINLNLIMTKITRKRLSNPLGHVIGRQNQSKFCRAANVT